MAFEPKKTLQDFPLLLQEWDYSKNFKSPEKISYGTRQKFWWVCKNKHSWEARANDRTNGKGCPFCSGKQVTQEESFGKRFPYLLEEWDWEKNFLSPFEITSNAAKKIFWKCSQNHSWEALISNRTRNNSKCPYCSGKLATNLNCLENKYPHLLNEWDWDKNDIFPSQISYASNKKVWWKCSKNSKHLWMSSPSHRCCGSRGCPYCSHKKVLEEESLFFQNPELMKEWNFEKNKIDPKETFVGSSKKAYWKCKKEHEWEASIIGRTKRKYGCPFCANKKASKENNLLFFKEIINEWDWDKNLALPENVLPGSHKKFWWSCAKCSYSWQASANNRTKTKNPTGCPNCAGKVKKNIEKSNFQKSLDSLCCNWEKTSKKSGIYKITNTINENFYIGSSINLSRRLSSHRNDLKNNKHSNRHLQSAWNLYGEENFLFHIVEFCEESELINREQYFLDGYNPVYNIRKVADRNIGVELSEETRKKMSTSHSGEKNYNSILSWEVVNEIRSLYGGGEHSYKEINKKYGIAHSALVINNQIWRDENYVPPDKEFQLKRRKKGSEKLKGKFLGEKSSCAKYNWELINSIRKDYKTMTVKEISIKYEISKRYIRSIVENKKWHDPTYNPVLTKEELSSKLKGKKKNQGEANSSSKLKKDNIQEIINFHEDGMSQTKIAERFGVCQGTIWKILNKHTWNQTEKALNFVSLQK